MVSVGAKRVTWISRASRKKYRNLLNFDADHHHHAILVMTYSLLMVKTVLLLLIMVMTKDRQRVLWGRLTLEQGIGSGGLGRMAPRSCFEEAEPPSFFRPHHHPRHSWQFLGPSIIENIM